jgi:hypothetical protein
VQLPASGGVAALVRDGQNDCPVQVPEDLLPANRALPVPAVPFPELFVDPPDDCLRALIRPPDRLDNRRAAARIGRDQCPDAQRKLYPEMLSRSDLQAGSSYVQKLVKWERDRVLKAAKGIAGTAATYFAALIPLIFKNTVSAHVSGTVAAGTVLGFLGCLLLALDLTNMTTVLTRDEDTVRFIGKSQQK